MDNFCPSDAPLECPFCRGKATAHVTVGWRAGRRASRRTDGTAYRRVWSNTADGRAGRPTGEQPCKRANGPAGGAANERAGLPPGPVEHTDRPADRPVNNRANGPAGRRAGRRTDGPAYRRARSNTADGRAGKPTGKQPCKRAGGPAGGPANGQAGLLPGPVEHGGRTGRQADPCPKN
jgi:hypothetical protein